MCPTELRNLVFSLEYLVSNESQVLMGGIRLDGSAIGRRDAARATGPACWVVERRTEAKRGWAGARERSRPRGVGREQAWATRGTRWPAGKRGAGQAGWLAGPKESE